MTNVVNAPQETSPLLTSDVEGQIVRIDRVSQPVAAKTDSDESLKKVPQRRAIVAVEKDNALRLRQAKLPLKMFEDVSAEFGAFGSDLSAAYQFPVLAPLGSIEKWKPLLPKSEVDELLQCREPFQISETDHDATGVRNFLATNARGLIDVARHNQIPHVIRKMLTLRRAPDHANSEPDLKHPELERVLVVCNNADSALLISEELKVLDWVALWAPGRNHRNTKRINADWELFKKPQTSDHASNSPKVDEETSEADEMLADLRRVSIVVTSRQNASNLLFDRRVPLDAVVFVDAATATFKDSAKLLRAIPSGARLFGIVTDLKRYPLSDIDMLRSVFGDATIMINSLHKRACRPDVRFEVPPCPKKKIALPQKGLSEGEKFKFLQDQTSRLKFRNKAGCRLAARFADTWPSPDNLNGINVSPHSRIAVVVADDVQLADVLSRSDPEVWRGYTNTPKRVVDLKPGLKPFVGDTNKNPPPIAKKRFKQTKANRFVVVTRSLVTKVGQRDVFIRLDGGRAALPLTREQMTVTRSGEDVIVFDFDDSALSPELRENARARKSAYLGLGFRCRGGPPAKPQKYRPKKIDALQFRYTGGKKSGGRKRHGGRLRDIERGRQRSADLRDGIDHMSILDVADGDVLVGLICELQDPTRHGQNGGCDGIGPLEVGRQDRLLIAKETVNRLHAGQYYPGPVKRFKIPKERGGTREIHVQTLPDRIVANAISDSLIRRVHTQANDVSFAVRGFGATRMLATIKAVVDESKHPVIAKLDVRKAFDTVCVDKVLDVIDNAKHVSVLHDDTLRPLFAPSGQTYHVGTNRHLDKAGLDPKTSSQLIRDVIERMLKGERNSSTGISQGCPLSPIALDLLFDAHLDAPFNDWKKSMSTPFWQIFRYVDDIVIVCSDVQAGEHAAAFLEERLDALGMTLRDDPEPIADLGWSGNAGSVVLGHQLACSKGKLEAKLPGDWEAKVKESLLLLGPRGNPRNAVRQFVRNWVKAYAYAFTSSPKEDEATLADLVGEIFPGEALLSEIQSWVSNAAESFEKEVSVAKASLFS